MADARLSRRLDRPVEGRAQKANLHEIVEMAGLQRSVLAIVGEAEELARAWGEISVGAEIADGRQTQDGGGRTPPF